MREPKYSDEAYRIDRQGRKTNLWRCTPGIASEFIHHLSAFIERIGKLPVVVLYSRVSHPNQEQSGNLDDQTMDALRKLLKMGFRLGRDIIVFEGVESSRLQDDRFLLERAIEEARKRGAILVAVHRDRLLRNRFVDPTWQYELPVVSEYVQLLRLARDVPLATIQHPDDPAARSDQIKRGQRAKGNRGGRPAKRKWKERRLVWIHLARKMREAGLPFRQIADRLNARGDGYCNVTHMTVRNWLKRGV